MTVDHDPSKTAPHRMEEAPIPLWQKIAAATFAVLWMTIIVLWHARAAADFYPPDRSYIAPNLLASFIIASLGLVLGALVWPPTRRRLHRFMDRKLDPIHEHLTVLRQHHEAAAAHREEMTRQIARIHEHLGIATEDEPTTTTTTTRRRK